MLPDRPKEPRQIPDGRYGDEVITLIVQRFRQQKLSPHEFQVKLFGGAHMFIDALPSNHSTIGGRNIQVGKRVLESCGFKIQKEDVGQCVHRTILFEIATGDVWVRQSPNQCEMNCITRAKGGCPHGH
jgi:chemotaxis protein CheD